MRTHIPSRLLILTAFGVTLVGVGATGSQAADPFVAGGLSTRPVAPPASAADRALARAAELSRAIGLPGETRRVERVDDRFDHLVYDEVVSTDRAGRDVAIARFATDGRLVMAVALGWHGSAAKSVGQDVAATRAEAIARASGLVVRGTPAVRAVSSGWSAQWQRVAGGVPVRGDGIRILLWPDGSFHGVAAAERPLAAAPARRIGAGRAREIASATAAGRYGSGAREFTIESAQLAWVAPNDAWAAAGPDAPAETLRLAWVVTLRSDGSLAGRLRGLQVWVDAGDGRVIGGDVLE